MKPTNGFKKVNHCPYCGLKCDLAIDPTDIKAPPQIGALSICAGCYKVSIFDHDFSLKKIPVRMLTPENKREIKIHITELKRLQAAYKESIKNKDKKQNDDKKLQSTRRRIK
jgi:hypothetical protein